MAHEDPFWFDDPSILFNKDRVTEFFPAYDHTDTERLNAIMRFAVYLSAVLFVYNKNTQMNVSVLLGTAVVTIVIHSFIPKKDSVSENTVENTETMENTQHQVQCTAPTLDNPFMNVTMKDYLNVKEGKIEDRPPACAYTNDIKEQITTNFNNNLYKDVDDIFGKMNSQRQFYTMPSTTIPNKQDEFAKWLYSNPKTCKELQDNCLRYEDVRAKSSQQVLYNPNRNPITTRE